MKKNLYILGILLFFTSCNPKDNPERLRFINQFNTLKLSYQNNKCGEWGGDIETLIVYRDNYEGPLFVDYLKQMKDCQYPVGEFFKSETKNRIQVSAKSQQLIVESINQLSTKKLSRANIISHSGLFSQVIMSDSSMILNDFPSARWTKFEELTEELLKE
jgi:hypothetical protein